MARPREFEEADAVDRALQVFWKSGFQDASLPDLLEGMGLTRGSLYKAFKDKKNLYLNVLDHYEVTAVDTGVAKLTDPSGPDGTTRILRLFSGLSQAVSDGDQRGCVLCTAAAGPEMSDPEIAAAVRRGLAKLRDGIEAALDVSERHKGFAKDDKHDVANALLGQYVGLKVLARAGGAIGILEGADRHARLILSAQAG
ncbi:TetR/AcrR family transcriptional regulator [Sulfitobacter sp. SK012]|uniref:TetR/AcrR family transcriptional regulator n=1 Tax=Sulfitobacter sp. SK012 TaxID=1389005 RepID=UPI0013B36492|nr:TetR/AcrR family transcriptional regulator [Sulfitobacter sp. SK012]